MKFSASLSTLLVIVPFLAQQVLAAPQLSVRAGKGGNNNAGKGGAAAAKGGNNNAGKGGNNNGGGAAAASSAAAAASTSASNSSSGSSSGNATANNPDLQNSLTLDSSVIATGFEQDGNETPAAGQVASLTSGNNFINYCATVSNLPITNGQQITTGSCNPAPMGVIAATTNMPSCKFTNPKNMDTIAANQNFTITMAIQNLDTGNFVNAEQNFFAAPQQVNSGGQIVGHSHVVVEKLDSLAQTTPTDPTTFAFFKGLNDPAENGVLSADVSGGLPAGTYRLSSINSAANHQPVLVAVAQHGSLDDQVYFTVSDNGAAASNNSGNNNNGNNNGNNNAAAASSAADASSTAAASAASSAAAAKGGNNNAGKGAAAAKGGAAAAKGGAAAGGAAAAKGGAAAGGAAAAKGGAAAAKGGAAAKNGRRFLREY